MDETILRQNTPPEEKEPPKPCNCREPNKCPLKGECLVKEVVYQATITTAENIRQPHRLDGVQDEMTKSSNVIQTRE